MTPLATAALLYAYWRSERSLFLPVGWTLAIRCPHCRRRHLHHAGYNIRGPRYGLYPPGCTLERYPLYSTPAERAEFRRRMAEGSLTGYEIPAPCGPLEMRRQTKGFRLCPCVPPRLSLNTSTEGITTIQ